VDGTFTYDRRWLKNFCNAMVDQAVGIKWKCTARYDNLDQPSLDMMKRANCTGMYIGLESGSNRVLKAVSKRINVDKILEVSKMVYQSRIPTVTSVLLGLPHEDKQDLRDTVRLMKRIKTEIFDVNCYVPLPGTPLYDAMPEEDRENIDWGKVAYKSAFSKSFSRKISHKDFTRYKAKAYQIANNVRQKTILRLGTRMILSAIKGKFKRKKRLPAPSPTPTLTTDTNPGLAEP